MQIRSLILVTITPVIAHSAVIEYEATLENLMPSLGLTNSIGGEEISHSPRGLGSAVISAQIDTVAETISISSITSEISNITGGFSGNFGSVFSSTDYSGNASSGSVSFSSQISAVFDANDPFPRTRFVVFDNSAMPPADSTPFVTTSDSAIVNAGIEINGESDSGSSNIEFEPENILLIVRGFEFSAFPESFFADMSFGFRTNAVGASIPLSSNGTDAEYSIDRLSYFGGQSGIVFSAVPEPSSSLYLLGGLLLGFSRRHR